MPRSVNHVASRARRKKILGLTRGYFGARKNVWTVAKNTWEKGLTYAYRDRKNKKRNFRALWIQRINAAARLEGMSYSKLMGALHKAGIEINRKVLADLAMNHPEAKLSRLWLLKLKSHLLISPETETMYKGCPKKGILFLFVMFVYSNNCCIFVIQN